MSLKKYRVISETFWDGVQLHKQGAIVEIDTDLIKVNWDSKSLEPVGDSPVFETKVTSEATKPPEVVLSTKKSPRHKGEPPKVVKEPSKDELAKAEAARRAEEHRRADEARRAEEARRAPESQP